MPKLKKSQLAQVKYVSMADFYNQVDQFEDFNDKLKFTTRYLLTHSNVRNPDYSIEQAIHLARVKLADTSTKRHDEYMSKNKWKDTEAHIVDPYSKNDTAAEMFMANPTDYLIGEANKTIKELKSESVGIPEENQLESEMSNTLNSMAVNVRSQIRELDKNSRVLDVKVRMEAKYGGKEGLDKAYKATKGSFMSRLFGTSSTAAKNLDQVYKAFNNPNHVLYGNIDALDKAATQYIKHNFPEWELFQAFPTEEEMANLSDTEKERMHFSINTLKCLKDQLDVEERFEPLVRACEQKDIQYSDIKEVDDHKVINLDDSEDEIEEESLIEDSEASKEKQEELIDDDESVENENISELDQKEFREQLRNDIKEDEEYEFDQKENDNELNKEIEEEQIDDLNNTK